MRRLLLIAVLLISTLAVSPAHAGWGAVLCVDELGNCGGKKPCYPHPQDAVNAAKPGDPMRVYPGTYGSRFNECSWAPNCSCSDNYAPALGQEEGETLGFRGNTVSGCVLGGVDGVTIWHPAYNTIAGNTIKAPVREAIIIYDGYSDLQVGLSSPSKGNRVYGNRIIPGTHNPEAQAVFVGAWNQEGPTGKRTDNTGTQVYRNDCSGMGLFTAYSDGRKEFYGNSNVGGRAIVKPAGMFRGNPAPTDRCGTSGVSKLQVRPP
jgi:hypothetical protein